MTKSFTNETQSFNYNDLLDCRPVLSSDLLVSPTNVERCIRNLFSFLKSVRHIKTVRLKPFPIVKVSLHVYY